MQSFDAAFTRLTGHPPFRWQTRLFDNWFSRNAIPDVCDLPTGLGKTATMAVWLIARAGGVALPRRLIYVVDRRAVVDQATRFAQDLRVRASAVLGIDDLPISTLRGRFADNRQWLKTPDRLAIMVGTIDMIGSRLLFSGYGVSRRQRPYHAGFIGVDALVVLDEAHLCPAFESLIGTIAKDVDGAFGSRSASDRKIVPPLRIMSLSATGREAPDGPQRDVFALENEDRDEPLVRQRISAAKHLWLRDDDLDERAKLQSALAERAWTLGTADAPARVVVYCDRRSDAMGVKKQLDDRLKKNGSGASALLVGARRVNEREDLDEWLREHGFVNSYGTPADGPTFLIATSAGEVGVDLDADHMVCDLVAWERMVQRLGRVNRRGASPNGATVDVFAWSDDVEKLPKLKAPLIRLPQNDDGSRDASPAALAAVKIKYPDLVKDAMTPHPPHAALTRAVVDAWSLTSLDDHSGRPDDIQPWLRGWQQDEPQTTVIWRQLLPWRQGEPVSATTVDRFFSVARAHLRETLEAPSHQVFDLLTKRAAATLKEAETENGETSKLDRHSPVAILLDPKGRFLEGWRLDDLLRFGRSKGDEKKGYQELIHGGTIVVVSSLGGLNEDGMLDDTVASEPSTLDRGWIDDILKQIGYRVVAAGDQEPDGTIWKLDTTVTLSHPEANESGEPETLRIFIVRDDISTMEGDPAIAYGPQKLIEHHAWVEEIAGQVAKELRLPRPYAAMLAAVARYHDLGKKRDLWQNAMNAPAQGRPYAKIDRGCDWRMLNGYRHEFGSLRDVETVDDFHGMDGDMRDLALHLIAAHHGRGRPMISSFDPAAAPSEREMRIRNTALRFARLQRRWGPWGLAWWETLLRSSDQRASAKLSEEDQ